MKRQPTGLSKEVRGSPRRPYRLGCPPQLFFIFFWGGGDTRLGALPRRTWPRCASGTARSELRRTWTGWWAWAAPGGHRDAASQSGFIYFFLSLSSFFMFIYYFYHHFSCFRPQRQRRPGDALQGGQGGGQDGALRLHGTTTGDRCRRFNLIPKLNSPF